MRKIHKLTLNCTVKWLCCALLFVSVNAVDQSAAAGGHDQVNNAVQVQVPPDQHIDSAGC